MRLPLPLHAGDAAQARASGSMTRPDPPQHLPPRLIVADPGLRSAQGHNLGYSVAVAQAARAQGIASVVLASRDFRGRLPDGITYRPSFAPARRPLGSGTLRRAWFGLVAHLPSPLAAHVMPPMRALREALRRPAVDGFGAQLAAALAVSGDTSRDLVLLHTVSAANLTGLSAAVPPTKLGALAIVLRHTPEEMDRVEAGPQPIATILAGLAAHFGARLRLVADTAPLAGLWSSVLDCRVGEVPLPVVAPPPSDTPSGQPPHVVFAGGARAEKGYGLLPELVRLLADEARFTIHSGPIGATDDPLVQRAHRKLRALAGARLTLLERPLPPEGYLALLSAADLLLLPYYAQAYGPRSSGILAEARAMGVPAVVPAGCWLGDEVGPDPALRFRDATGIAPAVQRALARLPALREEYAAAAPAWRRAHSPAALLAQLLRETR